ncbi:MAG: glycosyltransferase, partial [Dokdonella sp.]
MPAVIEPGLTSVIVVSANSGPLAAQCIDTVLASSALLELIVVDNASCDDQIEHIQSRFGGDTRLRVLRNTDNIGFGPACNKAAKVAHGDWLLIVNPDCFVEPDTIYRLREVAASLPQAGILGVRAVTSDGRGDRASRRRDPTLRRALCSLSGLARLERRWPVFSGIEMP